MLLLKLLFQAGTFIFLLCFENNLISKRYAVALRAPALLRLQNDDAYRQSVLQSSAQLIQKPWQTDALPKGGSREFNFLRSFWNIFQECVQSCQALDLIRDLAFQSMNSVEPEQHTAVLTFWIESYLNEVYIVQCRLLEFIKFIQRRYKKDADFTQFVNVVGDSLATFVCEQLGSITSDRGIHVHERRHRRADPAIVKLNALDTIIGVLGHNALISERNNARRDANSWLLKQVQYFSDLSWHLFDDVCRGFSDGILLEIDRIIVPMHLKDDPKFSKDSQ